MTTKTTKFVTKLGTTKGAERSRIWLQGARLVAARFLPGQTFYARWDDALAKLTLTKRPPTGVQQVGYQIDHRLVSGKGDVPIIDITGTKVRDTFGKHTHVAVEFTPGRIVVTREAA